MYRERERERDVIHIYIYIYIYIHTYMYICMQTVADVHFNVDTSKHTRCVASSPVVYFSVEVNVRNTVSFHNYKSQNFKLSVSNPKSKYVAYLSVLSQISNCQSLGRKNKHDILKTHRTLQARLVITIWYALKTPMCESRSA